MKFLWFCCCAFVAATAWCGEGFTLLFPPSQWRALTNFSAFREIRSATNLPPAVLSSVEARCDGNRISDPAQPWSGRGAHMVWAVTDGEYYVVHYERFDYYPIQTNYGVSMLIEGKDTKNRILGSAGYMRRFATYQDFIAFEAAPRHRK